MIRHLLNSLHQRSFPARTRQQLHQIRVAIVQLVHRQPGPAYWRQSEFIPAPSPGAGAISTAEGVAANAAGNVDGAEVGPTDLKKYARK
jgi:hypothetical protein